MPTNSRDYLRAYMTEYRSGHRRRVYADDKLTPDEIIEVKAVLTGTSRLRSIGVQPRTRNVYAGDSWQK